MHLKIRLQVREASGELALGSPDLIAEISDVLATDHDRRAGAWPPGRTKLRDAGKLDPDRIVAVTGIGGLGSYAVQYAKLLGGGATVVALSRTDSTLAVAKENGADYGINVTD